MNFAFSRSVLKTLLCGLLGTCCLNSIVYSTTVTSGSLSLTTELSLQEEKISHLHQYDLVKVPSNELSPIVRGDKGGESVKNHLENGGNPNLSDYKNRSLLSMVSYEGDVSVLNLLLQQGANVRQVDTQGHNALYMASSNNQKDALLLLITHIQTAHPRHLKAMINQKDCIDGTTALHVASAKGHHDISRLLLESGADVDQHDIFGRTALHVASYRGQVDVVRLLLDASASVTAVSKAGLKALDYLAAGNLKRDLPMRIGVENSLRDAERRVGIQTSENREGERRRLKANEKAKIFMDTFQRKCESIFLSYRLLNEGLLQQTQDSLSASNVITLLGNVIPLPGAGLIATVTREAVSYIEKQRESAKVEFCATLFVTNREMEQVIEQTAYALTVKYEHFLVQLTLQGAEDLALCGVGRLLKYIRERTLDKNVDFIEETLNAIQIFKTHQGFFPWTDKKIETENPAKKWTDLFIFQSKEYPAKNISISSSTSSNVVKNKGSSQQSRCSIQ